MADFRFKPVKAVVSWLLSNGFRIPAFYENWFSAERDGNSYSFKFCGSPKDGYITKVY